MRPGLCTDAITDPAGHFATTVPTNRAYLGALSDPEISLLIREFGLHVDFSEDVVAFPESAAARSLKRIIAEDTGRAALFRKKAKWLDAWLSAIAFYGPDATTTL